MSERLKQLCRDRYGDEDVAQAVYEDAVRLKNVEKIEAGELVLPGPQDARQWAEREKKVAARAAEQDAKDRHILDLTRRLEALEGHLTQPQPMPSAKAEESQR